MHHRVSGYLNRKGLIFAYQGRFDIDELYMFNVGRSGKRVGPWPEARVLCLAGSNVAQRKCLAEITLISWVSRPVFFRP